MKIGSRVNNFQTVNKQKDNQKNEIGFRAENRQIRPTILASLIAAENVLGFPHIPHNDLSLHAVHQQPMLPVTTIVSSQEHGHHGQNQHTHDDESGIDGPNGHSLSKNGKPPSNYIKSKPLIRPTIGNENINYALLPGEKPPIITMDN